MIGTSYIIIACYPDKGMKSYGSKSLIEFNKKKLLQYQIDTIKKDQQSKTYEIIVISDFDTIKLQKHFDNQVRIIQLEDYNPIYLACEHSKYSHVVFIDYGCLFEYKILKPLLKNSTVVCSKYTKVPNLEIGCISNEHLVKHMFFDLPDHKFCNIFSLCQQDKNKILQNSRLSYFNLLSFEIINTLIESGSCFRIHNIQNENFLYFNHMRQKNAANKFVKKTTN